MKLSRRRFNFLLVTGVTACAVGVAVPQAVGAKPAVCQGTIRYIVDVPMLALHARVSTMSPEGREGHDTLYVSLPADFKPALEQRKKFARDCAQRVFTRQFGVSIELKEVGRDW